MQNTFGKDPGGLCTALEVLKQSDCVCSCTCTHAADRNKLPGLVNIVLMLRIEIRLRVTMALQDMAATVAFLASEDASYMTAETLVVAGGMQSRL